MKNVKFLIVLRDAERLLLLTFSPDEKTALDFKVSYFKKHGYHFRVFEVIHFAGECILDPIDELSVL